MTARERPILFSAPMVRAILLRSKTQTRRVLKCKPSYQIEERDDGSLWPWMYDDERTADSWLACPYGKPGDYLWVRETWCDDWKEWRGIVYRADGGLDGDMLDAGCKWRPSIFMPRAASRITLEVTSVRVERLQDISEADAMAEGVYTDPACPAYDGYRTLWDSINAGNRPQLPSNTTSARYARVKKWLDDNPDTTSWDANPFVWVIEFRRLA